MVLLPIVVFFILQNQKVQTYITQRLAKEVSENLDAKFEVGAVHYRFFNRIVLKNVYIEDQLEDTLFYSKEVICKIKKLDRENHKIEINKVNLLNAKIYLHKFDTLQPINMRFGQVDSTQNDSLKNGKPKWEINLGNVEMHQSVFRFKSVRKKEVPEGVTNFNDLVCYIDDLDVRNLSIKEGVVDFYTKRLKFKEKEGFYVYNMKFNMSIGKKHMIFRNVKIRTPYSYINSDSLCFHHNNFDEYQYFAKNIKLDFGFQESNISFKDVAYFSPVFKGIDLNTVLSGRVYSKLSTFKGKDLMLRVGEQTELITDFNLNGLPNHKQMFMYVDFKKLTTAAKDFDLINKFIDKDDFALPESFDKLGIINYKGNFAGFYDDFVTYGKLISDLGSISTDLSLRPDTSSTLAFSGNLKTNNFQIGELVEGTQRIGKISMDAQINGSLKGNKTFQATTMGLVHDIVINDYLYQNILIDGFLTEKTYNGYLSIDDPNIHLDFSGGVDFSKEIPEFNFRANVPKAYLYGLNIDKEDTTSNLSFDVKANFKGIDLDNGIGEIKFFNTKLTKFNEDMIFDTLNLVSNEFADTHKIELKSDYIDASLTGIYKSSTLIQSFKNSYFYYLPALVQDFKDTLSFNNQNSFLLEVALKKTSLISKFFLPGLTLSDKANVKVRYNDQDNHILVKAFVNELKFKNHTFDQFTLSCFSNDSAFTIFTKSNALILNNYFTLDNFKATTLSHKNTIDLKLGWDNNKKISYKGNLFASTTIKQDMDFDNPLFDITILPSKIIVKDSLWDIANSKIVIDSSSFKINNFKINNKNQFFIVDGKVSANPQDTLYFKFGELDLANVNVITSKSKLEFGGIINGDANVSNIYNTPLFYGNISVDKLVLNKEEFGFTQIFSRWIENDKAIQVEASTLNEEKRIINISGNYYPNNNNILFNIVLNKLGLHVLNPYLSGFASNLSGFSDGTVLVTGTLKKPEFNGSLFMQDAAMTINYLKTRYTFSTEVNVQNNSLVFSDVDAYDSFENKGDVAGFVKFGPQKAINFDFDINANNIHALNTTSTDNPSFYGTAFMSGLIKIEGDRQNTFVNISANTEKNTKVNIPLTYFQGDTEVGFVKFVDNSSEEKEQNEVSVDYSGFRLNFDLDVTPDAEAQLIFDSKIGDVIRGRGKGSLNMEIGDDDEFRMYGDYTIEEGDYLFTLQNVINKRFKIEQGGNITWNGNPSNANINIEAVYGLKTSLNSLVDTSSTYYANADYYKKRIPVECQVFLTNRLTNPDIGFDINLPTADEEARTLLKTTINTEEKLNRQFLSLLVLNSFIPEQSGSELSTGSGTSGLGTVTTSELLSNQLSNWLSQISDEWDIGVNYRPGGEISKDQVEVALSTQFLNDRVSINGNVGYVGQENDQASDIVGDFNLDVKLTPSGKLRFKVFNESNDKLIYKDAPYTQGVGVFYREEFNSLSELFDKIWGKFRRKEKEEETKE